MDKALELYAYILRDYLTTCFANQQNINPVDLNRERFNARAVFIASIIFLKNNTLQDDREIVSATNRWLKKTFTSENLFSRIIDNAQPALLALVNNSFDLLKNIESVDIATLYESLLGIETGNENNATEIINAKNYRNKLGSYYTPAELAKSVTQKTVDTFFELNYGGIDKEELKEIASITIADFSCGGGNFIIAVIDYFESLLIKWGIVEIKRLELLKIIALNISAFDVDCLALEVAKLSLLLRIEQPSLYKLLEGNFIHANFLLQSELEVNNSKKIEVFSSGFIYHEQLSLNKNKLKRYDIILGNPPWEKIRFEEKKFYALYAHTVSKNHFKSSRTNEIAEIELLNPSLARYSAEYKLENEKAKRHLKNNSFFSLSNYGELNTYALFTDAAVKLMSSRGVIGLVLKSAVVTSQVNKNLFEYLVQEKLIVAIYDFINRKKIFDIDSRERFCFLLQAKSKSDKFQVSMNLTEVSEIENSELKIELPYDSLKVLNPLTGMLPNFSNEREADFLLRISRDFLVFKNTYENVKFGRIVHLTNHADYITNIPSEENIPIYEGKFFNQFDGKYAGFNGVTYELRYGSKSSAIIFNDAKKNLRNYYPESRFFISAEKWKILSKNHVAKYMLAWRSLTSATNRRTCIATILPFIPASQSVQFLTTTPNDLPYLVGLFNSVVFDFILKKKLSGIDLTQTVINQMPVPKIEQVQSRIFFNGRCSTVKEHVSQLVFSLLKNDVRLNNLFNDLGMSAYIDNESRFDTIRKIDLLFMFQYKLNDPDIELVLSEFSNEYSLEDLQWFKSELKTIEPK